MRRNFLNFEQFSRSVLLAQGEFTSFLKAKQEDKSELLEKLTGTEIYSKISKKVYDNFKVSQQQKVALENELNNINALSNEELAIKKEEFEAVEIEITNLNNTIENLNTLLSIFSSTRNLYNSCFQFNTQGLDGDMEELDISKFRKDFLYSKNTNIVGILTLIKGYNLVAKKYVSYLENELELKDDFFLIQNLKPNLS